MINQKLTVMKQKLFILLAFFIVTSCQDKVAQEELSKIKAQVQLEKRNKELVKNYFNELGNTESDELSGFVDKYISSDIVLHLPEEEINSKDGLVKHYVEGKTTLPSAKQTINDIVAEEDKVAFRGVLNAVLPDEKEINVKFAGFWQIRDGKIVEWWSEY